MNTVRVACSFQIYTPLYSAQQQRLMDFLFQEMLAASFLLQQSRRRPLNGVYIGFRIEVPLRANLAAGIFVYCFFSSPQILS